MHDPLPPKKKQNGPLHGLGLSGFRRLTSSHRLLRTHPPNIDARNPALGYESSTQSHGTASDSRPASDKLDMCQEHS